MNGRNNKPILARQSMNGKQKPNLSESSLLSAGVDGLARQQRSNKIGATTTESNITTKNNNNTKTINNSHQRLIRKVVGNNNNTTKMGVVGQKQQQQIAASGTATLDNGNEPKLIKKAYVRFDDYLDLNEENMRRSCKRLMNHLYSEPLPASSASSLQSPSQPNVAPAISTCRTKQQQPIKCQPAPATGAPNKLIVASGNKNEIALHQHQLQQQQRRQTFLQPPQPPQTTSDAQAATSGKSYLRSQYERRQLRQLELMQQETAANGKHAAGGANARRHQQDLMAKSHELSKRRFFEKLERRESMKNLNLSTTGKQQLIQQNQLPPQPHQKASPIQITTTDEDPQEADKQKKLADDELMLKMYQSIVLRDGSDGTSSSRRSEEQHLQQANKDTLQGSGGTHAKEQVGELIEFHTESPQSKLDEPERLIELSGEHEECLSSGVAHVAAAVAITTATAASTSLDQSNFEIKVPAPSSGFLIQDGSVDGLIDGSADGLLVVKQVEDATLTVGENQSHQLIALLELADADADRPPTSIGRHIEELSTTAHQKESNKTKKPLVDSTDNKVDSVLAAVEQINGQGTSNEIMEAVKAVKLSTETMMASSTQTSRSTTIGSDNQHAADGVSSVISSGNSSSSNKMEAVPSLEVVVEETTDNGGKGRSVSLLLEESASCHNETALPVEVGGELNRAKDHEAPETSMLVEQSGGVEKGATASALLDSKAALVAHKQSAAQAQQEAGLQTTITKPAIRDVLPEANGAFPSEAIVSGENEFEKVRVTGKQVNEVQQQQQRALTKKEGSEYDIYANPTTTTAVEMLKNNVNHDEFEAKLSTGLEAMDLMDENAEQLIESFEKHQALVKKHSTCSTAEEDGGSSCSSSGFGASVSVTSSSDGFNSGKGATSVVSGLKRDAADFRRPSSLALITRNDHQQYDHNPIYDSVRLPARNLPRTETTATEFLDYKQIVGPGQAYPESRAIVIDNHNYASVVNRCSTSQLDPTNSTAKLIERDNLDERYANLPKIKQPPPVEYATIRVSNSSANKKKFNATSSEASLSGHSFSTSSAKSGGFSALPPTRIDCSPANILDEAPSSMIGESTQRKSSILKRFGSLVSKAFATNASSPVTSKINEPPVERKQPESDQTAPAMAEEEAKPPLLVIEKEHEVVADGQQVGKADLVILPTKHVNQQRKLHPQEKNPPQRRHDDDRLSRAKKHSRKMKHTDSSSSVTSESSSFSSSSSTSQRARNSGHLKKADSLSEELESLMSRSEHSNHYRKKSTRSSSRRAVSSGRHEQIATTGRIDIDCVSPTKVADKGAHHDRQSASGPRSLLRIFGSAVPPSPQRAAESTPNLANSLQPGRHVSLCDNLAECEDDDSLQPISGFWGFTSLIGSGHATADGRKTVRTKGKAVVERDMEECDSRMYASLKPLAAGYRLHRSSVNSLENQQQQQLDKYQSLNLYQNLLRNYNKRRHRCHGHHHHYHHHHNRLHHNLSSRHAHSSSRYTQSCSLNCNSSSNSESSSCAAGKTTVWGQLIKINKSDGSQVIELQRCPGKSWGFFVARGAINNMKGIFISRMHDKVTSDSLTGLLSIGDRILAIDECPIEPDYDILRVNQMISKKSKILLKVKPFKG